MIDIDTVPKMRCPLNTVPRSADDVSIQYVLCVGIGPGICVFLILLSKPIRGGGCVGAEEKDRSIALKTFFKQRSTHSPSTAGIPLSISVRKGFVIKKSLALVTSGMLFLWFCGCCFLRGFCVLLGMYGTGVVVVVPGRRNSIGDQEKYQRDNVQTKGLTQQWLTI